MIKFTIPMPLDMHVHLREGAMLDLVAKHTAAQFSAALIMPNTTKSILTGEDVKRYQEEILMATREGYLSDFTPLMTIKLTEETTVNTIMGAHKEIVAAKLYPQGVTTNSADGVRDWKTIGPALAALQDMDKVLCIHGEHPESFVMDREEDYLDTIEQISEAFPKLRIVLEHISTRAAAEWVESSREGIAATITAHHLFLTLDDVVGGMLKPHNFCKPIAKREEDRDALRRKALSGHPKFFLGTDSAPHAVGKKECHSGCAGVFSAPVAMGLLAELFFRKDQAWVWPTRRLQLQRFAHDNAQAFYRMPFTPRTLQIMESDWQVPNSFIHDPSGTRVIPFYAGRILHWFPTVV